MKRMVKAATVRMMNEQEVRDFMESQLRMFIMSDEEFDEVYKKVREAK